MCLCEHWMGIDQFNSTYINGYTAVSKFCRSSHIHGGSAIFVKNNIVSNCKAVSYFNKYSIEMNFECAALVVNKEFLLVNIYRPTSGSEDIFFIQLSLLLSKATQQYKFVLLCGDLNIDQNKDYTHAKVLKDIFSSFNLTSLVSNPTRIANLPTGVVYSTIDYMVTNIPDRVYCVNFDPAISDHHCQIANCNLEGLQEIDNDTSHECQSTYRQINAKTINEFKFLFGPFELDMRCWDIDYIFDYFWNHFIWCFDAAFAKKIKPITKKGNKNKIIFSNDLYTELQELKNLNWLRKQINCGELENKYKKQKTQINRKIEEEKKAYYNLQIKQSTNKSKSIWRIVNNLNGKTSRNSDIEYIRYNDVNITDRKEIANIFGNYYSTVIQEKLNNHFNNSLSSKCTTLSITDTFMTFSPVTAYDVKVVIKNLPNKKSTGLDEIPIKLIKECSNELAPILADIINASILTGTFPNRLKIAALIPIFKKGASENIDNYRPIALLSIISKIIEKVVSNKIFEFLNQNSILSNCQYGFRAGFSTEASIVDLSQTVYEKMDSGERVCGVFFDLSKAFDTVDRDFVAQKLHGLGIHDPINRWIISYLTNRKVVVKIGTTTSEQKDISIGTPQGSVLGPLIFLLYVNDLPSHISHGKIFMYADDTSIVISDPDPLTLNYKISVVLVEFKKWCYDNRLIINHNKTILVEFGCRQKKNQPNLNFNFHGFSLAASKQVKFLGITLDHNFNFYDQIDDVCSKLNKGFYVINSLKNVLNRDALLNVYYALIYSPIAYSVNVWGQSSGIDRVFILQKRVIRLIFNLHYHESCRETFKNSNLFTVTSIYLMKLLTLIHTNKSKVPVHSEVHNYNTRGRNRMCTIRHDHEFFKKSPYYAGTTLYNKLPLEIQNSLSLDLFKKRLKILLLSDVFYSLQEFTNFLNKLKRPGI